MGGGQSIANTYRGVYVQDPSLLAYKKNFETLCLRNSDVKRLYDIYQKMDNASDNAVEVGAILLFLEIDSDFLRKVFVQCSQQKLKASTETTVVSDEVFTQHSTANVASRERESDVESCPISFDVFVYSIWSICSLQPSFFELFVFDVYLENDDKETLSSESIQQMLIDIYGANYRDDFYAQRAMSILQDNDNIDDYYDIDDFYDLTIHNQVVHFAIFTLQTKLQAAICQFSFWERISEKRYRAYYGYTSISEILKWGEYSENCGTGRTRKFSTCSHASQSRFIVDLLRQHIPEDDGVDSAHSDACSPFQTLSSHNLQRSFCSAFMSPAQQGRSGVLRTNVNGIDDSRRRSFDVTIILKENVGDECDNNPLSSDLKRRHSISFNPKCS